MASQNINSKKETDSILPYKAVVHYYPAFISENESEYFYKELLSQIKWEQVPIVIFGKKILQPRLTAWFADEGLNYRYSGIRLEGSGWHPLLLKLKIRIELFSGLKFNSALLNYYRDGNDSMGWHRDNEKELGSNPAIASLSFGAVREFRFRTYLQPREIISVFPQSGSLIIMRGATQEHWQHSVPKTKKSEGRINITFRRIL
jgi:alkylated DNA repair dioxygenase AlkB